MQHLNLALEMKPKRCLESTSAIFIQNIFGDVSPKQGTTSGKQQMMI